MSIRRDTESGPSAEGFSERWSRRKQEADRKDAEHPVATRLPESEAATEPLPTLTDDDMPPVESLDERSDYAAFLSPGISEQLKAQALRKLFRLPGMHLPDGLDDYDEDFTRFAEFGNTITHEMQRMLDRELASDNTDDDSQVQTGPPATAEPAAPGEDLPVEAEQKTTVATHTDDDNVPGGQS